MDHKSSKSERDKLAIAKLSASLKENQERGRYIFVIASLLLGMCDCVVLFSLTLFLSFFSFDLLA